MPEAPVPAVPYAAPPRTHTSAGNVRAVGIEVEFGQLSVEEAARIVAKATGGAISSVSSSAAVVEASPFGKFKVEVDAEPVKEGKHLTQLEKLGVRSDSPLAEAFDAAVVRVARVLVPIEIVSPPIPWTRLAELDPLWAALRDAGAEDTKSALRYAFGLHLNPELPDLEVSTVVTMMRSFFLLEGWLDTRGQVDLARRLTPFINPFPEEYRRLVIDPRYAPDWQRFVSDYVEWNPTRNRPLDVLPLIVEACAIDLESKVENWSKVKARPAFHYRRPNSELSQPGWTPAIEWNRWVMVERLVDRPALLEELALAYTKASDLPPGTGAGYVDLVERHLRSLNPDDRPIAT